MKYRIDISLRAGVKDIASEAIIKNQSRSDSYVVKN